MTREEATEKLKIILEEATEYEEAVCYVTSCDADALDMAIRALETPPNDNWEGYSKRLWKNAYERGKADARQRWIPVSERLPEYGVSVLTYDGICYCVEKRIPTIRDDNGEPIFGEWWVSDDYDESNSEYYPNLRDGACIAWMPLPEPYKAESEDNNG